MASSVTLSPAVALDGQTYSAEQWRQGDVAALAYNQGTGGAVTIRPGVLQGATRMQVAAGSGMSVNVNGGACVIPSGVSSLNGAYRAALMAVANLTVATSDPVSPRVDAVAVYVDDLGTSSSTTLVEVFTGTPTPGATLTNLSGAPSLPVSSISLAYVLVPAGSTSVTSGNVSDQRTYTVAPGGIIPLSSVSAAPAGNPGQFGYDAVNDRIFEVGASGPSQARTLPWAPQVGGLVLPGSVQWAGSGGGVTLASVTVTVDGSTDLEIDASWSGYSNGGSGAGSAYQGILSALIGSAVLCQVVTQNGLGVSVQSGGGSLWHVTQSGVDRPASGTYTISLTYFDAIATGSHHTFIFAPLIRVKAATL